MRQDLNSELVTSLQRQFRFPEYTHACRGSGNDNGTGAERGGLREMTDKFGDAEDQVAACMCQFPVEQGGNALRLL